MSRSSVQEIVQRWLSDEAFREELFWNADATLHRTHLELDWDEFSGLRAVDWRAPADELRRTISALVADQTRPDDDVGATT